MASIADVYITVLPETSRVAPGIRQAVREATNLKADVGADTTKAKAEIQKLGGERATVNVDADTGKASTQIDVAARDRRSTIEVGVDRSSLSRATSAASAAGEQMSQNLMSSFAEIGSAARGASSSIGMIVAAGAVAGLVELAGVAASAAQALWLIPAAAGAAGMGIGTLALGLSGVSDAYEAVTKAATDSGREQANQSKSTVSANRSVEAATRSLSGAVRDEKRAQGDVAKARKDARIELEDLNDELRGGAIDQTQAWLDLVKSTKELQSGMFETPEDYMQAQLNVIKDQQRLNESVKDNARLQEDANDKRAKGVDGADEVVAANERLAQSQENITVALQNLAYAQQSAAEAASQVPPSVQAMNDAMAQLSPNAQNLVNTLFGLKPAFDQLKFAVQDALFANMGAEIQRLAGTYLPMLQTSMSNIAGSFGQMFSGVTDQLMTPETQDSMQNFLNNVASAFKELAPAAAPLTKALADIMSVGSGFLPDLARAATDAANAFSTFITEAKNSGDLKRWMSEGLDTLKQLGSIAWSVTQAFFALAPTAKEVLPTISKILTDIKDVMPVIRTTALLIGPSFGTWTAAIQQVQRITDLVKSGFEKLPGIINTVGEKINQYIVDPLNKIIDLINKIPGVNLDHIAQVPRMDTSTGQPAPGDAGLGRGGANQRAHTGAPAVNASVPGGGVGHGADWDKVAGAESSGRWDANTGNGFFGGLQFKQSTWDAYKPAGFPARADMATPEQQKQVADLVLAAQGPGAWPATSAANPGWFNAPTAAAPSTSAMPSGSYGLPTGTNTGGYGTGNSDTFPPWVMALADQFGIKPSTYAGHQESDRNEPGYAPNPNHENRGIDWSGPVENMQKFADYLATIPGAVEQVIWQNPSTGTSTEIAGGKPQPGYFSGDLADHQNHVHTRQSSPIPMPGDAPANPATSSIPTGTPGDPTYIALDPNIPSDQRKTSGTGDSSAKQLGRDLVAGIAEVFGFGDLFKDPTEFGLFKGFKGVMGALFGSGKGRESSGNGGGMFGGGGGAGPGGILSTLTSMIPAPFGDLTIGSPKDAPGQFMPGQRGSGGSAAQAILGNPLAPHGQQPGSPGPGNYNDFRNANFGHSPTVVQDQVYSAGLRAMRQPVRALPG